MLHFIDFSSALISKKIYYTLIVKINTNIIGGEKMKTYIQFSYLIIYIPP